MTTFHFHTKSTFASNSSHSHKLLSSSYLSPMSHAPLCELLATYQIDPKWISGTLLHPANTHIWLFCSRSVMRLNFTSGISMSLNLPIHVSDMNKNTLVLGYYDSITDTLLITRQHTSDFHQNIFVFNNASTDKFDYTSITLECKDDKSLICSSLMMCDTGIILCMTNGSYRLLRASDLKERKDSIKAYSIKEISTISPTCHPLVTSYHSLTNSSLVMVPIVPRKRYDVLLLQFRHYQSIIRGFPHGLLLVSLNSVDLVRRLTLVDEFKKAINSKEKDAGDDDTCVPGYMLRLVGKRPLWEPRLLELVVVIYGKS